MRVLITGGTGLIGRKLIESLLKDGHQVVNLGRGERPKNPEGVTHVKWDGKTVPDSVGDIDAVVNLAGASIAGQRWSAPYKQVLMNSRVDATLACTEFIQNASHKPGVFISASGFNYYGDLVESEVTENSPAGSGFLSEICRAWEAATADSGVRTVLLRTAVVLDPNDGPLAKMLPAYKLMVGGPTGTGDQGFPWIHIDDMVSAIRFAMENPNIEGPVNMAAPNLITSQEFSNALAKALNRPNFFRLPKPLLEVVFGEMAVVLWGGAFVLPNVLKNEGFQWKYPEIGAALKELLQ
jgi:uncharacterized protein (TIGR01777 family)